MKKFTPIIAAVGAFFTLALTPFTVLAATTQDTVILHAGNPQVSINEESKTIEAIPYIEKDTTMVPLRFLCQDILNATVVWDQETKGITITGQDNVVQIDTTSGKVTSNGQEYTPALAPTVKGDYTFVPLRLLSELFQCTVNYESENQKITVITPAREVLPPVAQVKLVDTWTPGQPFPIEDTSYDPAGKNLTEKIWTVTVDSIEQETDNLTSLLKKMPEGAVSISYRVKSATGLWSEPYHTSVYVIPNKAPVITMVANDSNTVDIGQALNLTYHAENEPWEEITEVRWNYSIEEDGQEVVKNEKPRAFFQAGDYKIYLTLTDAYGNVSDTYILPIQVTDDVVATEKEFKFSNPLAGEIFLNLPGDNYNSVPTAQHSGKQIGDVTLLASNNPEQVSTHGILYRDTIGGNVRIRFHHRNTTGDRLQINAIAHNASSEPITLTYGQKGLAGPSLDVIQVGMQVVLNYMTATNTQNSVVIQPGQSIILNEEQGSMINDAIVAGLIDVHASAPLDFMIVAVPPGSSAQAWQNLNLEVLPLIKTHIRGTFPQATIDMQVTASGKEIEKVPVGRDDSYVGYFINGTDATRGAMLINNGNRGVLHHITITAEDTVGVWVNPRGTIFRGVLLWDGEICMLGNSGLLNGSREGVVLGTIEKGESKTITYMAPSGSDSPLLFILEPEDLWSEDFTD